ncbi:hypothetical protein [Vibrio parahaemolyticus]|uniref:hypothetical protein n=1 Tax=Vibrio parahaemolyticus TaxID=670 RepID=UPI0004711DFF|nr:hypothetical protein [Vibrio parahaemolyticus]HCG7478646.1 hypothetical protein [Vibrio parahaemolyticus]HCH2615412.1 hypothetical protein [Vibrio parahaemolyticus]HCM1463579.1 hypothetical protein [Vibrio parahaemolyticus]HCM1484507.1 hypothetical protein [Vibrio parahaemolyticus]
MAKRSNRRNNPVLKVQPKMQKNTVSNKVEAVTGESPDSTVMNSASNDELNALETLCDQIKAIKEKYESDVKKLEKDKAYYESLQVEIETKKLEWDQTLSDHEEAQRKLAKTKAELLSKEKNIVLMQESLAIREAEAEAGFIAQHQASLSDLSDNLEKLRSTQREVLEQGQKELYLKLTSIGEERNKVLGELEQEWQRLTQKSMDNERLQLELKERQLKLDAKESFREEWEQHKKQQIEREYVDRISELERELTTQNRYRARESERFNELKERLSDFGELDRLLKQRDMSSAASLINHIDELEANIRDYRTKLEGRPIDDLEDEVDYLKDQNQLLEDQLRDRTQELQEANLERHQRAMGVMEREQLAMKNRVLQQHNEALSLAAAQLKRDIEDLKDMQQGQAVFPALTRMDRELSESAATQPIPSLAEFVDDLQIRISQIEVDNPLYFDKETLRLFLAGLSMSQLHIFQGISGTGKTSLAKAFAKSVGGICTVVPVQAGWRDRDDIVGHYNAFEKRYYEKECLQALYRAQCPKYNDRFNIILLDEMNLSRPEQYFAEFLSAMELSGDDRQVILMEDAPMKYPKHLREGRKMGISDNVWFIGTANHDETTFEFADKTHDRSFVLELGRNDKNGIGNTLKIPATYSVNSLLSAFTKAVQKHGSEVDRIFNILKNHEITSILEKNFGIGWGNRLERQARQFIPVVMASGGTSSDALDHLLSVRLFRDGKVTGRYDTRSEHLKKLQNSLHSVWESVSRENVPVYCDEKLNQEIERKGIV